MGAGDVKLMAAVGAVMGPANWFAIFLLSNILGGVAAVLLLLSKGRLWRTLSNVGYMLYELAHLRPPYMRKEELDLQSPKAVTMPHGLAIAVGSISFLVAAWIWYMMQVGPSAGLALSKVVAFALCGLCLWTNKRYLVRWINYWYAALVVWNMLLIAGVLRTG
jgi:Flp pilus assembly protein protease CpaA